MAKDRAGLDAPIEWTSPAKKSKEPNWDEALKSSPWFPGTAADNRKMLTDILAECGRLVEADPENRWVYTQCGLKLRTALDLCEIITSKL
jgi:hypothetical protein